MKYFNIIFLFVTLSATALTFSSCNNNSTNKEEQGKEFTSAYVCPMHCDGSGSDEAGKCPVCSMDYVQNETHAYACSMHPEITGIKGDTCSKCGMDLTPVSGDDHKEHNH